MSHAEAERTLELLLEHGVNHIDTAASYGDSELRIAPWLKRHPGAFFVATKTDARDYKGAKEELHRSLERLGVDHVDLLQLHNLVDVIEWEFALREDGALEAAVEARDGGARPLHRRDRARALDRRHAPAQPRALPVRLGAAALQLPPDAGRAYAEEFEALAATCARAGSPCRRSSRSRSRPGTVARRRRRPGTSRSPIRRTSTLAVHWVLGREGVFLNTVGDVNLLPRVLAAAERVRRRAPERRTYERARAAPSSEAALRLTVDHASPGSQVRWADDARPLGM